MWCDVMLLTEYYKDFHFTKLYALNPVSNLRNPVGGCTLPVSDIVIVHSQTK